MQRGVFVAGEASSSGGCAWGFAFGHCGPLCQLGACWSASPLMPPLVAFGCAWGFAFGRCGPLCWRRKLLPAGYLSVCPAVDCAASRRVRSRLLGSGGSLDSEADAVIVGGIQRTEPRHVGGAPGSAARLPVGRALLVGQAIVVGFVCPANPNR